jgi:hypothetical protein
MTGTIVIDWTLLGLIVLLLFAIAVIYELERDI